MGRRWCAASPGSRAVRSGSSPTTASDRKSTRLNSSHSQISYAVFCLKKKKKQIQPRASSKHAAIPPKRHGVRGVEDDYEASLMFDRYVFIAEAALHSWLVVPHKVSVQ